MSLFLQRALFAVLVSCALSSPSWSADIAPPNAGLMLKKTDQGLWVDGLKSIAIASLALAGAAGSLLWLKHIYGANFKKNPQTRIPILKSSSRISQKTLLLVVQWEDKIYLLAENAHTTQLLDSRAIGSELP